MSVQAGVWNMDRQPVDRRFVSWVSDRIAQWGPDGESVWAEGPAALIYRPFHTTAESRRESQPVVSDCGFVLTWDGRLDNRAELAAELHSAFDSTDLDLIVKGFKTFGVKLFAKIVGDWALTIWFPAERKLILARDVFAVRHLYYQQTENRVFWSTILDPIVQQTGASWALDYEYIAGFLAFLPEAFRTPYAGISAVPPASWVEITPGKRTLHEYWTLVPKRIRYKTNDEYDAHFRDVFRQAVRRRLCADAPIVAELSGGMDSSSIVCMADHIMAREGAETPRIDTVSYYDDGEWTGDERQFVRHVEEQRGRTGLHVHAAQFARVEPLGSGAFAPIPGYFEAHALLALNRSQYMSEMGSRVVLCGRAGDEFCGGRYDPSPYLADLVTQFQWIRLMRDASDWSLRKRLPLINVLGKAWLLLLPLWFRKHFESVKTWIDPSFGAKYDQKRRPLIVEDPLDHLLPSQRDHVSMYWIVRRAMASSLPSLVSCQEVRYPYVDRDFVEFMAAVPGDQWLQPGRRRPMMRRALRGIVPEPILERTRKAVVDRRGLSGASNLSATDIVGARLGITDVAAVAALLDAARAGNVSDVTALNRLFSLEFWLRAAPLDLPAENPGGTLRHAACNTG